MGAFGALNSTRSRVSCARARAAQSRARGRATKRYYAMSASPFAVAACLDEHTMRHVLDRLTAAELLRLGACSKDILQLVTAPELWRAVHSRENAEVAASLAFCPQLAAAQEARRTSPRAPAHRPAPAPAPPLPQGGQPQCTSPPHPAAAVRRFRRLARRLPARPRAARVQGRLVAPLVRAPLRTAPSGASGS